MEPEAWSAATIGLRSQFGASLVLLGIVYAVLGRVAALDDVLLNGTGAALGILLAGAVRRSGILPADAG